MVEYIDKHRLKEAISADSQSLRYFDAFLYDLIMMVIDEVPVEDVAHIARGKWAHVGGDEWCCTNCGFVITTEGGWEKPMKNFCENCGARMDKEKSNES